ncbi:hypothetical protein EJB05_14490 [Eragrostis curvula]|uniref:Meg domain-containing protein n=1 Tax=Eragrostis curvula TaxID=38414 RepID=A0A5J9VX48_9POAL|nr:hypothetical protein EJB05_14490 [Eragrostis curvula]
MERYTKHAIAILLLSMLLLGCYANQARCQMFGIRVGAVALVGNGIEHWKNARKTLAAKANE